MKDKYILVAYKKVNGYVRQFELLEQPSNHREALEYIKDNHRYDNYKENGYILEICKGCFA